MSAVDSMRRAHPLAGIAREIGSWSLSLQVGAAMMLLMTVAAIFAPWVAPYDPNFQDFMSVLLPPSFAHPFGTDSLGRDVFSRVIHGARVDLQIGVITTYVPMIYGVML